ncbi:MAG: elongation factor P [Chloroflexi bacterium]|jgi:elongation factor P|nr:MAG: elongation factor P [Chloroflexota bacterium]
MISYSDLKRGIVLELDGEPWQVIEYQHTKMQQQAPTLTLRIKHLKTGQVLERKLPGHRPLQLAQVDHREAQYLYGEDGLYNFMDQETFDQYPVGDEQIGDAKNYLIEGAVVGVVFFNDNPIAIELPTSVELAVTETNPGYKGDTAQGGTKPATLETGLVLQVPLFVNEGDKVKVDTRTGSYLERV